MGADDAGDGSPAPRSIPVTVIIAARDEEDEIAACVRSVSWAREVLVVENDSRDATVERAREAGATVFSHPFVSIGAQRNAAIARASEPWILVLDADERATPAFGRALASLVASPPGANADAPQAFRVRRRNFFFGREIRHGGWERDRPVRVFAATLRYDERPVHEHVIVSGAIGEVAEPLLHTPYASLGRVLREAATLLARVGRAALRARAAGVDRGSPGASVGARGEHAGAARRLA